jgi:hypothetical protein
VIETVQPTISLTVFRPYYHERNLSARSYDRATQREALLSTPRAQRRGSSRHMLQMRRRPTPLMTSNGLSPFPPVGRLAREEKDYHRSSLLAAAARART